MNPKIANGHSLWRRQLLLAAAIIVTLTVIAIIVSAAASEPPPSLIAQLRELGRMIIPIGTGDSQQLQFIRMVNGNPVITPRELVHRAYASAVDAGSHVLGATINFADTRSDYYSYGYHPESNGHKN